MYDYLTNTDTGFVWVPSLMISNKVVANTLFNFIDFELLCVVWLVNPIIITLVPYTTSSHSKFHTLTFTHKLTFSLTLFIILLILHRDFVQQCFRNLGKLNMAIFNIMYTDGYIQLVDKHLRETPISTTPFPNYINTCSTETTSNTAIRKIENTVVVPGFVAYPYLDDPFDDIDNQDKYLLHNYNNSPDAGFSFIFNGINGYYSQFCKHIPFIYGSIEIDAQLFRSYNQQLFISIFNMINSYNNQKHNIWKNINYLQYFYHLFPTHVENFYSLFHSYVNPKIDELKKSIQSLDGEKRSINNQIFYLNNTEKTIENLSTQINANVDELNKTIGDSARFNTLVGNVKKIVCCTLEQVKEDICEAVKSFESKIEQMVRDSRGRIVREARTLSGKIEKHARSAEKKLERYINNTEDLKSYLTSKASLMNSISTYLIGVESTLIQLQKLKYPAKRINETYIVKYNVPFEKGYIPQLKEFRNNLDAFLYDKGHRLWVLRERIEKLIEFLVELLLEDPTYEIIKKNHSFDFNKGVDRRPYDRELEQIRSSILKLVRLEKKIGGLRRKIRLMGPIEAFFKEILKLKTSMEPIKDYIEPRLLSFIEGLQHTGITKDENVEFVKGMESGIQKTIIKLHNVQKIIKFLQTVEHRKIPLQGVPELKLEQIENQLGGLRQWKGRLKTIKSALSGSFRENIKQILQIHRHDEIVSGPARIKEYIDEVVPGLIKHVKSEMGVLKIISEIKKQLDSIKSARTNLNGAKGHDGTSDIEKALEYLKEVDGKLTEASKSIESTIAQVKTNYEQNENKINGRDYRNGAKIQKNVLSIGQVPNKIAELRSQVRYNIVLLNIAKSVNETLDKVKVEAGRLECIKFPLGYLKKNIERIIERYECISGIVGRLGCFMCCISLMSIKGDIVYLRQIIDRIREDLGYIKWSGNQISKSITKINEYLKDLLKISLEIAIGFSKVGIEHVGMPGVLVANPLFGSILHGFHGLMFPLVTRHLLYLSVRIGFIMAHLSWILIKLERIVGSDLIKSIEGKVNEVDCNVTEVESSIESIIICFIKCSNKHITENTKESTKRLLKGGTHVYNNEPARINMNSQHAQNQDNNGNVWTILSNMAIIESKFVASRLYDCDTKTKEIKESLKTIYCECAAHIGCRNKPNCIKELLSYGDIPDKFNESKERYLVKDDQNYICICLVIRYVMYPNLAKCASYVSNMDYDSLSIMDRKFDEFNKSSRSDSLKSKLAWLFVNMADRLWNFVKTKYLKGFEVYSNRVLHCFCRYPDSEYSYFISTILYISFLVENIFENETTGDSIKSLSALKAELNYTDSYPKRILNKIIIKDCTISKNLCGCNCECGKNKGICCCCICLYCWIVCVCICLACKICNSIKESCDNPLGGIKQLESVCKCDCGGKCCIKELLEKCKNGKNGCEGITGIEDLCPKCCTEETECCCNELKKVCKDSCEGIKNLCKSSCPKELEKCTDKKCACCKLFCRSVLVMLRFSNCVIKQIYTNVMVMCLCCCGDEKGGEIKKWLEKSNLSYNTNIVTGIRENRIVDSTSVITNNKFEVGSNNNYTYNDAYRINTSRAHGSLKYIIIKIVLILIIVVMTIFIRVKIETDDDYKIDNLLREENDTCECDTGNENGRENGNQINIKYNGAKNNGTRKTSRTKGMKKKSLMIVMSIISGLYLNVVIRDLYVVLSLEYNVWSYFVSVVVCLGLTCSLLSRYCVHLYDFVYVLEQYGLKMSKVESLVDDKFGGESGTSMISSQFVMLYGLLKSVVGDLTSALSMSVSQSSYNEMKDELYPYKNMAGALHRMISGSDEYLTNLGKLRESVMESAIVGGCVDLYNVLDFLSYVLMSKTFFEFDEYQAYFHGNERYVAWRLGKSLNHNFFLVSYYRYSTIYSIDAQVQNLKLGEKHMATRNCMMLWQMFGEMEIELITLKSMCEESLDVPMTDIQKDLLKSRFVDEYLTEFQKFQLYVVSTLFNVREHTRVRTREIESSFPFASLFNEQMLDKNKLSKLSAKYFDTNYRRLLSSMSLPTRTCDVSGHVEEVQRRVSAFCSHWLDLRYEYCKSIRSLGCEKAVNFAHDMVMSTLREPEQIDTKITQMLANINLENIDFIQQLLETDETLKEKYQLKEFHNTLDTLTHIHPISDNYETTVLHYLNQYVISSLLNKDKIMFPLGIYLSWYGAALSEQHITHIHKYKYLIWIIFYIFNFLTSNLFPLLSMSLQVSK